MIRIKRGDTFKRSVFPKDANNPAVIESLVAQIRSRKDTLIEELVVEEGNEVGEYIISSPDTSAYPPETVFLEMRFVIGGEKFSSRTVEIIVERGYRDE